MANCGGAGPDQEPPAGGPNCCLQFQNTRWTLWCFHIDHCHTHNWNCHHPTSSEFLHGQQPVPTQYCMAVLDVQSSYWQWRLAVSLNASATALSCCTFDCTMNNSSSPCCLQVAYSRSNVGECRLKYIMVDIVSSLIKWQENKATKKHSFQENGIQGIHGTYWIWMRRKQFKILL
jgi:hypothetical protein